MTQLSAERRQRDDTVRKTVENAIRDIEDRGDDAVRDMSRGFDRWDRPDYRLGQGEIESCLKALTPDDLDDIRFAQEQVRRFAEIQRSALSYVEAETMPGVILGHRNIPMNSVGCYVPGGKYPLLASAHMSVVTAKVAGVKRVVTCAPPFNGKPAAAIVAARHLAGAENVASIAELEAAIGRARASDRTYVIAIRTHPYEWMDGGSWWDVGMPEVSGRPSILQARDVQESDRQFQRQGH